MYGVMVKAVMFSVTLLEAQKLNVILLDCGGTKTKYNIKILLILYEVLGIRHEQTLENL